MQREKPRFLGRGRDAVRRVAVFAHTGTRACGQWSAGTLELPGKGISALKQKKYLANCTTAHSVPPGRTWKLCEVVNDLTLGQPGPLF